MIVQLLTKRRSVFKTAKLPQPVWDARVSSDSPLKPGDWMVGGYGIAVSSNIKLGLVICKSKTAMIVKSKLSNHNFSYYPLFEERWGKRNSWPCDRLFGDYCSLEYWRSDLRTSFWDPILREATVAHLSSGQMLRHAAVIFISLSPGTCSSEG